MSELKPCPFCGELPDFKIMAYPEGWSYIRHFCEGPTFGSVHVSMVTTCATEEEVAAAWNRRAEEKPSTNAVEVVRCKDCKYHYWEQEPCHGRTEHFCRRLDIQVSKEDFCSNGRRKERKND